MRKAVIGLVGISLAAGLVAAGGGLASASPAPPDTGQPTKNASKASVHDLPNPLEDKRRALREEALKQVLKGESKIQTINGSQVVRVGTKQAQLSAAERARLRAGQRVRPRRVAQYVELAREDTDKIFVVLTEFGNERHPDYPDQDTDGNQTPGPRVFDGPLHNAIPAPNRAVDNTTIWQPDYSADHYRKLYFGEGAGVQSLKTYYEKQSSGRYSVDGMVTDWVKVRYNEARYGRSDYPTANNPTRCAANDNICTNTWNLLDDGLDQWVADQKAKGRTDAQIKADLKAYDEWDRYDYDGDGNFNEPDGYIDHFQIVHAGGDQADGDPYQAEDAIWSHRWRAFQGGQQGAGPSNFPIGGTQIGTTGLWVADYTIQPENGGLSVFAHEYGHDLGLPDHYDRFGGDNAVNWWTLMAQSRVRARNDVGIGTRPADLGVWDKLQLGWLDYEVAVAGQRRTYRMGPHEYNSRRPQALAVVLPDKQVTTDLVAPASGTKQWWSGSSDNLTSTLTRTVAVPAGSSTLSFQANYDIETGFDYAAVEVNDGSGWKSVKTSISNSTVSANGIDGTTGSKYVPATADMSAYAGKTVQLRFVFVTDGGVLGNDRTTGNDGFFVDDIALRAGSTTVFSDGAESGNNGWTPDGFSIVGNTITTAYDHFYLASYRAYLSYDRYLRTGPYNFGFPNRPDYVEFFPYENGLLVNYWDTSYRDNDASRHPGNGLVQPIDAHPRPIYRLDGKPWRGRIQTYDAPFSLRRANSFTLHAQETGQASYIRGQAAQPLFDDTRRYWYPELPTVGVKTPGVGVTLEVTRQDRSTMTVRLGTSRNVSPAAVLRSARAGN